MGQAARKPAERALEPGSSAKLIAGIGTPGRKILIHSIPSEPRSVPQPTSDLRRPDRHRIWNDQSGTASVPPHLPLAGRMQLEPACEHTRKRQGNSSIYRTPKTCPDTARLMPRHSARKTRLRTDAEGALHRLVYGASLRASLAMHHHFFGNEATMSPCGHD